MLLLLNVLLLVLATMTALTAIGGETWVKNRPTFFERITRRGWVSTICLTLTLITGIAKEFVTQSESEKQKIENEQLKGQIKSQLDQINGLRSDLKEANKTVTETNERIIRGEVAFQKNSDAIQTYVYGRLLQKTNNFLSIISQMVEEASDGWLPTTEREFFSRRSVDLICRELNADAPARVEPPQSWFRWFAQNMSEYKQLLIDLLKAHGTQLDTMLINSISAVEGSGTFAMIPQYEAIRRTNPYIRLFPPLLCHGDGVEALVEKDFATLFNFFEEVRRGARKFRIKDVGLPLPKRGPTLGKNRFTAEQLSKWVEEHNPQLLR